MAEGIQFTDEDFGSVVLLVCAIGSRWSKDRRVLLDEEVRADDGDEGEDEEEWHSAGWKWFKQVRLGRKALFSAPSVSDIQVTCVRIPYGCSRYHRLCSTHLTDVFSWQQCISAVPQLPMHHGPQ